MDRLAPTRRPARSAQGTQRWHQLLFSHWEVDAAELKALVHPRLTIDTFEGKAFVGVVSFTMQNVRPWSWLPGAPTATEFYEINVRTYVHLDGEEPGIVFFSLDATSRLAVAGARLWYGLPYFAAEITLEQADGWVDYRSVRRNVTRAAFHARYQPTGPVAEAAPGSLEFFLAERYVLYARSRGSLRMARVHHAPYPLQPAAATGVDQDLTKIAGLSRWICREDTHSLPLVHYALEVDVQIFGPQSVS